MEKFMIKADRIEGNSKNIKLICSAPSAFMASFPEIPEID